MITKEEAEKAYQQLVVERQKNPPIKTKLGEVEVHHILPKSCGGLDDPENKVALYAKEHFMAHVYLWIIHHDDEFHYQMAYALNMMVNGTLSGNRKELREFILQSEEYQKAKEECAQLTSKNISDKISGEKNGMFGKSIYHDPMSLETGVFKAGEQPKDWIKGNVYKDKAAFKTKISENSRGTVWIHKKDLSQQKHIKKDIAEVFLKTCDWELGHLPYSDEQKQQQRLKSLETQLRNGTRTYLPEKRKAYPICLNCGKENPNKFARCCCNECKREYDKNLADECLIQKHLIEAQMLEERGYFDAQTTALYKGIVNRKQVRRYLKATNHCCCNKCGKTDVKFTVHAIDNNPKNLNIDNFEFLCRACYNEVGIFGYYQYNEKNKSSLKSKFTINSILI